MKKFAVAFIALATAFTGVAPAHAFPGVATVVAAQPQAKMPGVEEVRERRKIRRNYNRHGWRNDRRDRRHYRNYRRHDYDYGRHYRPNYGGAIIGGLAAGAILGGVLNAQPRRYYNNGNSHAQWCYNRYRSYRASDNTYQPYNGGRRQCVSP